MTGHVSLPTGEAGPLAVEITPLVVGGHPGIEDRAITETLGALHVERINRPTFSAGTGSVPSRNHR